ncbi:Growth-regulating factor 9 [Sesamum alatum]|uniref:Growth-regulating factor n=1 Tax=Sesamum alatum TaxID=300844 RepID=A0AAE2CE26_9LAMI|nr:Growth-regulating factor 9 [Sesamum alatum]
MHSQLLPAFAPPAGYSEKINLDLGIGSCACADEGGLKRNKRIKQEKKESLFTELQFHEFYSQILVYNSIASGLPVPFHLFLPIWTSVFNSLGPSIYKKYPSFLGISPENSDQSYSIMDPEPGRCRRTDGRKWRCSKNVVPLQKYCERHMHRGRQGSRKHVETIENVPRTHNKISDDNRMPIVSLITPHIDNGIAISFQSNLDPRQPCSNYRNGVPETVRSNENRDALLAINATIAAGSLGNEVNKNINVDYAATSTSLSSNYNGNAKGGNHTEKTGSGFENPNPGKISGKKHIVGRENYLGFISPRFGLSPKSVLRCGAGKVSLELGSKNVTETERQRCRRTDGKKWQCRRDAIPHQKYCEAHMHRGAKRFMLNPQFSSNPMATSARMAPISCNIGSSLDNGINLNTIPASPQHVTGDNSTSSTSDATTITDENISYCLNQSFHNC